MAQGILSTQNVAFPVGNSAMNAQQFGNGALKDPRRRLKLRKNAFRSVAATTITPRFPIPTRSLSSLCVACIYSTYSVKCRLPMQVEGGRGAKNWGKENGEPQFSL